MAQITVWGALLFGPSLCLGQSTRLSKEDVALIKAAETPEDLVELAKLFALQQKSVPAAYCIQRACEAKPELLTDDTLDTSSTWNTVWFATRGMIRLKQLDPNDVEGRLELARWLHRAGVYNEARQLLEQTLKLDEDNPQALALAKQWNLSGGGPIRFDLRMGLTEPLIRPSIQDEGQLDEARKDRRYLLVPFRYEPRDRALNFNRGDLKATFNDGSTTSSKGILLLEREAGTLTGNRSSEEFTLRPQSDDEPVWERLTVEPLNADDEPGTESYGQAGAATYALTCYNTTRPRTGDRTSGSYGRSRSSTDRSQTRQDRKGSGFAAFLLEIPEDMTSVDCVLDEQVTIHLEKRFLLALRIHADGTATDTTRDNAAIADDLLPYLSDKDGQVAWVAVIRVADLHRWLVEDTAIPEAGAPPDQPVPPVPPLLDRVDRALIKAISHPDGATSQAAFTTLIDTETPLHPDVIRYLTQSDLETATMVLEQIDALLADRPPGAVSSDTRAHTSGLPDNLQPGALVAGLPVSTAPANVFNVLSESLGSPHAELREMALRISLRDGSQQSILILNKLGGQSNEVLLTQMNQVEDPQLKSTILRVLVLSADEASIPDLIKSSDKMKLYVKSGADPLLTRLSSLQTPAAAVPLLALFTRADFADGVAESPELMHSLNAIPEPLWKDPYVQAELFKLCAYPLRPAYASPVNYEQSHAGTQAPGQSLQAQTAFDDVLTRLALLPETNPQVVEASALQLVASGRIRPLSSELSQESVPSDRRAAIIRRVANDQKLWPLDATPAFLTARLADPDDESIRLALAFILEIARRLEEDNAWKFYFVIKRTASKDQLLALAGHTEARIAELASQLLPRLALMTKEDAEMFKGMLGESERKAAIDAQNEKLGREPGGPFMAAVRLELVPTTVSSSYASQPGREQFVLLTAGKGAFETSNRNELKVVFDKRDLAAYRTTEYESSPPSAASPSIDVSPLIRAALDSPAAEDLGLTKKLDVSFLNATLPCTITHDSLGTWMGVVQVPAGGDTSDRPVVSSLRVNRVLIILESLAPQSTF